MEQEQQAGAGPLERQVRPTADARKLCTCDGAGRGPGRACVVKAGGRLGELWRCAEDARTAQIGSNEQVGLAGQLRRYAGENDHPALRLQCLPRGVLLNAADELEHLELSKDTYFAERNSARDAWRARRNECEVLRTALRDLVAKTDELVKHLQDTGRLRQCFNMPALDAAHAVLRPNV